MCSSDLTRDKLNEAHRSAIKAYEAAREEFTKGEMLGKGEIRTGMRESEREDIRDAVNTLKRQFGLAEVKVAKAVEEEVVAKLPETKMPEHIEALQSQANKLMQEVKSLAKGVQEAMGLLVPVETRATQAMLDKFKQDEASVLDVATALRKGELIAKLDEAANLDRQGTSLMSQHGYVPYAEDVSKMAYSMYEAADAIRAEVSQTIQTMLKIGRAHV